MKNYSYFVCYCFTMFILSNFATAQGRQIETNVKAATGTSVEVNKCCSRIFVQCDQNSKAGASNNRLLSAKPFNGKNTGIDLGFEVTDLKGKQITSGWSIKRNAGGDLILNSCNLPLGCCSKKYRLKVKAGTAAESYTF